MIKKTIKELHNKLKSGLSVIKDNLTRIDQIPLDSDLRFEIATQIATKLRVLLYDGYGKSVSLLKQLDIKNRVLFPLDYNQYNDVSSNLISSYKLVALIMKEDGLFCTAQLPDFEKCIMYHFEDWWNEIIIDSKCDKQCIVSRKDVVLTLADKEGGAHEDATHTDDYYYVNYNSGFSFIDSSGKESLIKNNYYVESVIAIANEFVFSIELYLKYIKGCSLFKEKTNDTIIRLKYKNVKGSDIYRFQSNSKQQLNISMMMAYDHYRNADYYLLSLVKHIYRNSRDGIEYDKLVIDDLLGQEIVYLIDDTNESRLVLLKKGNGFIRIHDDSDIIHNTELHDLGYYKEKLKNGEYETLPSYFHLDISNNMDHSENSN